MTRSVDDGTTVPFCAGVKGREQCDDCAGRYVPAPGWSVPLRVVAHHPWPFEPCPHYVAPAPHSLTPRAQKAAAKARRGHS